MAVDFVQRPQVHSIDERPVFAARSPRRPRILRMGGRAAAALTTLWLVGLVVGGFGFGYLPGLHLPTFSERSQKPHSEPAAPAARPAGISARRSAPAAESRAGDRLAPRIGRTQAGGSSPAAGSHRSRSGSRRSGTPSRSTNAAPANGGSGHAGTTQRAAPGSRSQALTAPGRGHSTATPSPGSGGGQATTTQGNVHSSQTDAVRKTAQ